MSGSASAAPFLGFYHDVTKISPDVPEGYQIISKKFLQHEWAAWLDDRQTGCTWICKAVETHLPGQDGLDPKYKWRERWLCDHSGSYRDRRQSNLSPQKRRKGCSSKKVGCKASIVARKLCNEDLVEVDWHFQHTGHDPLSMETWSKSMLPTAVKKWIAHRVAEGRDWNSIHDLLRVEPALLDLLDKQSLVLPASLRVKRMDVYNALRQAMIKDSQRDADLWTSVQLWCDGIFQDGGWTYTEKFAEDLHNAKVEGWMVAFSTRWQKTLLQSDGQVIVCLDATHNTCTGTVADDKVQLYSLVVRNSKTGQGCPAAFMLTNNQSSVPIRKWLHAMKIQLLFRPQHFMIDCSDTEALGIHWAYSDKPPQILYCDWHLMKSLVKRAKELLSASQDLPPAQCVKISQELRKSAKNGFVNLMNTCTGEAFEAGWLLYQEEWAAFPKWIQYIMHEWIGTKDRWCRAWRQTPHQGIDTNNYIERWHGQLKQRYLGLIRRQRMDYLIHLVVDKVLPDYQQQEKAAELGLVRPTMNKAELASREKAFALEGEEAASMFEETDEGYVVQSFTLLEQHYQVSSQDVENTQCIARCTCPSYLLNNVPCKHMWIIVRNLGVPIASHVLQSKEVSWSTSSVTPVSICSEETAEVVDTKQTFTKLLVQDAQRLLNQCTQLSQLKHPVLSSVSRDALVLVRGKLQALNYSIGDLLTNRQPSAKQMY